MPVLLAKLDLRNSVLMWGQIDEKHLPELKKKSYRRQEKIKSETKQNKKTSFKVQGEAYLWGKKKPNVTFQKLFCIFSMVWPELYKIRMEDYNLRTNWNENVKKMQRIDEGKHLMSNRISISIWGNKKCLSKQYGELARWRTNIRNSPWINWRVTKRSNDKFKETEEGDRNLHKIIGIATEEIWTTI